MSQSRASQAIGKVGRLYRFHRMIFVEIDTGNHGVITAVTSNFSRGGLAAIGDNTLRPGDRVWLKFGDKPQQAATVVWRKARRTGFKFDCELDLVEYFATNFEGS